MPSPSTETTNLFSPSATSPGRWLLRLLQDEEGPTAVEYAVMLAMIVLVCLGAIRTVGQQTSGTFSDSAVKMSDAFSQ